MEEAVTVPGVCLLSRMCIRWARLGPWLGSKLFHGLRVCIGGNRNAGGRRRKSANDVLCRPYTQLAGRSTFARIR